MVTAEIPLNSALGAATIRDDQGTCHTRRDCQLMVRLAASAFLDSSRRQSTAESLAGAWYVLAQDAELHLRLDVPDNQWVKFLDATRPGSPLREAAATARRQGAGRRRHRSPRGHRRSGPLIEADDFTDW
jgi:hypothetical protein